MKDKRHKEVVKGGLKEPLEAALALVRPLTCVTETLPSTLEGDPRYYLFN